MKRRSMGWLAAVLATATLAGCRQAGGPGDPAAFQQLYDNSRVVQEFAQQQLEARLGAPPQLVTTGYGFIPHEPPTYVVGFRYATPEGGQASYGYKIEINEDGDYIILEEGEQLGADLL